MSIRSGSNNKYISPETGCAARLLGSRLSHFGQRNVVMLVRKILNRVLLLLQNKSLFHRHFRAASFSANAINVSRQRSSRKAQLPRQPGRNLALYSMVPVVVVPCAKKAIGRISATPPSTTLLATCLTSRMAFVSNYSVRLPCSASTATMWTRSESRCRPTLADTPEGAETRLPNAAHFESLLKH